MTGVDSQAVCIVHRIILIDWDDARKDRAWRTVRTPTERQQSRWKRPCIAHQRIGGTKQENRRPQILTSPITCWGVAKAHRPGACSTSGTTRQKQEGIESGPFTS